jgi:hypothetical protein
MEIHRSEGQGSTATRVIQVFLLLLLLCLTAPGFALSLEVSLKGDRLTVHAEEVPLQDILNRLARQGVKVRIDPEINPGITASFADRDLQKGLDSILRGLSHMLVWEATQGPSGQVSRLTEIQVFRPGKKELMKPLNQRSVLSIARDAQGKAYVKGEILVKLKPGSGAAELAEAMKRVKGVVDQHAAPGFYRVRLPDGADVHEAARTMAASEGIEKVAPNYAYAIIPPLQYTTDFGHQLFSPGTPLDKSGVPVAVLDTGFIPVPGLELLVLASMDALDFDQPISDPLGHGTQMALIASGLVKPLGVSSGSEPLVPIIPIRVVDENGFTSDAHVMVAIDFAIKNGAKVLSMSWGSETRSEFLETMLAEAASRGLLILASAGNEPTGRPHYPAAYPSVVGVGAVDPRGKRWERSNDGDFVALTAPGFASLPVGYRGDPGIYAGTSISAAFIANLASRIIQSNPRATKNDIVKGLSGRP